MSCGPYATCEPGDGGPRCVCLPGYAEDGAGCTDLDECAAALDDCDPNATCTNVPGSYHCTCNAGFVGDGLRCLNECPSADLGDSAPISVSGSTVGAGDFHTASCGATPGSHDYTATFTPTQTGTYRFDTGGSGFDTTLALLDGECGGNEVACHDGSPAEIVARLTRGQTVTAVVDGRSGAEGDFTLGVTRDACPDAELLGGLPLQLFDTTLGYDSFHDASCTNTRFSPALKVLFTAPTTATYVIDTVTSTFDTVLAVLEGECGSAEIDCNPRPGRDTCCDDDSYGLQSELTLDLSAGQIVTIVVTGVAGASGEFVLNVRYAPPAP